MQHSQLVPELYVSDWAKSLSFYMELLGFTVLYDRPEDRFASLERDGAQIMIEQTVDPERTLLADAPVFPYGRGLNLQIEVRDASAFCDSLTKTGCPMFRNIEDRWYRGDDTLVGSRQFVVQDPDGYLLRFFEDLGSKPST